MKNLFDGTFRLIKFNIKKDWVNIIVWLTVIVFVVILTTVAYSNLYSSQEDMLAMAAFFENPAMLAMMGPFFGADRITTASLFSASMLVFLAITIGIMNIFFVVRNTRADEERGRIEVIRSLPTGRLSTLGATLINLIAFNLLLALLIGISVIIVQMDGTSFLGAMLFGFANGIIGIFFGGTAAVFCQILSNSRGALGLSLGALGFFYLLRAVGDVENNALSMLSPLGIILRVKCFVDNSWWPVFVVLALSVGILILSLFLNSIRDLEQGLVAQRKGKGCASKLLSSHFGLVFRLLRNGIIAWAIGLFVIGISYGSILGDLETFIKGSSFLNEVLVPPEGHTQTEMFLTMIISMLAIAVCVPSAGAVLKLSNEEKLHRCDNILSKAISRRKVLLGYFIIGFVQSVVMLFFAMLGIWLAAVSVMETPITFVAAFRSFFVYLPAIWVIIGISVVLVGCLPYRASLITNCYVGYSFAVIYLGAILDFPKWMEKTSPFGFIPKLPMDSVNFWTLAILTLFGLCLSLVGYFFYKRRDIL